MRKIVFATNYGIQNGKELITAKIQCDELSELPDIDAFSGKILDAGSTCWVIGDGDLYGLTSSGEWVKVNFLGNGKGGGVGESTTGKEFVIGGQTVTAAVGAERFNDYSTNKAVGANSTAKGYNTLAKGNMSFAAGVNTKAIGDASVAFGSSTESRGQDSVAIGMATQAIGNYSFAGGTGAIAQGIAAFSFGGGTRANGDYSFAVGGGCIANGMDSYAEGCETIAGSDFQTVIGRYNVLDDDDRFALIIGNGNNTHGVVRSNALAVDWQGKLYIGNSQTGIDLNDVVALLAVKISESDIATLRSTVAGNTAAIADKISESDISGLRATVADNTANIAKNKSELAEIVDSGAKNLLDPESAVNYVGQSGYPISKSGITYSFSDNEITLSDTATSVSTLRIPITLIPGIYHMSGIPTGGSDNSYRADLREAGGNVFVTPDYDYGSGVTFEISSEISVDYCIRVANGYSPDNIKVAPMICKLSAWNISHAYQPYRPDYDNLIARIKNLEQANNISANINTQIRSTRTIEDI